MKAFRFPLESVLRLRRQVEEQRKLELAAAIQVALRQQRLLLGWLAEDEATKAALRELKRGGPRSQVQRPTSEARPPGPAGKATPDFGPGTRDSAADRPPLDLFQVRLYEGYVNTLARWIQDGFVELQRLRDVEDDRRRVLVRATQDRRVLERLRERRFATWRYEVDREEQKFLDEIGQQGFLRARQEAARS